MSLGDVSCPRRLSVRCALAAIESVSWSGFSALKIAWHALAIRPVSWPCLTAAALTPSVVNLYSYSLISTPGDVTGGLISDWASSPRNFKRVTELSAVGEYGPL